MKDIIPINISYRSVSRIWEWVCKHYCQDSIENHTCWRSDIPCNNLKNCDNETKKIYQKQCELFAQRKVLEHILDIGESIEDIY